MAAFVTFVASFAMEGPGNLTANKVRGRWGGGVKTIPVDDRAFHGRPLTYSHESLSRWARLQSKSSFDEGVGPPHYW